MILQTVKELEAKNHFLYIDKCHNSVMNYQISPINNPKRDIVSANAYAKFEWNPFISTKLSKGNEVRTDVRTMDGRTDGRTDTRTANMKT